MNYKYKKGQLFGKRLKVPKYVLNCIYNRSLSLKDYFEYDLVDKVPVEVLDDNDRQLLLKFGLNKCKVLDFDFIYRYINELLDLPDDVEDVMVALYEKIKDSISLRDYNDDMRRIYSDRFFDFKYDDETLSHDVKRLYYDFNTGSLSITKLIQYYDLFRDKDISYILIKNNVNYSQKEFVDFMDKYSDIINIFIRLDYNFLYDFEKYLNMSDDEFKDYVVNTLDKTFKVKDHNYHFESSVLDSDDFKIIFRYYPIDKFAVDNDWYCSNMVEELKSLPLEYIFDSNLDLSLFLDYDVVSFFTHFGIKNVIEFDKACGNFFTKDNCSMLRLMNDMYLHYAGNQHNMERNIYYPHQKNVYNEKTGEYKDYPWTLDEFYEAMRRMIYYGPSDWNYANKAPDYRKMTGEFKIRNNDLFIRDDAPEELKVAFYTKKIDYKMLREHPEYIEYLEGKDFGNCFVHREMAYDSTYVMLFSYIQKIASFEECIEFIKDYGEIIDLIKDHYRVDKLSDHVTLDDIKDYYMRVFIDNILYENIKYPSVIPSEVSNKYPRYFLDDSAPLELKNSVYNREFNFNSLKEHPEYKEYLNKLDLRIIIKSINVRLDGNSYYDYGSMDLIEYISKLDNGYELLYGYGDVLNNIDSYMNLNLSKNDNEDEILNKLDEFIYDNIVNGKIKYSDILPERFKNKYKDLFLDDSISKDLKDKFYNRELLIDDINDELLDKLGNTNIVCGLSLDYAWLINTFLNESGKKANLKRMSVIGEYLKIEDSFLREGFKDFVLSCKDNIDLDKIKYVTKIIKRLELSNSNEIYTFRRNLAREILNSDNPLSALDKIEGVFIRNNIPTIGKIYSCFDILHPNVSGFNFDDGKMCPTLKGKSIMSKKILLFSDLLKAGLGSNNKSLKEYIYVIKYGNLLYEQLKSGEIKYEDLSSDNIKLLDKFRHYVLTMFNNSLRGKGENNCYTLTDDIYGDLLTLAKKLSIDESIDYDLGDRLVKMFCFYSGIDSVEQIREYFVDKVKEADKRNRSVANDKMILRKGDFIKGIGSINFLRNILQNGSVSKEFLGSSAGSDLTPLDTDISMILSGDNNTEMFNSTAAKDYGDIWFVLRNDDRFSITRDHEGHTSKYEKGKLEVFYTGVCGLNHYGIRTGFASSEIDYIMVRNYDKRIGLEIAMNGFYIPVCNIEGEILFTPEDYDKLRSQMMGLSYYDGKRYELSSNLDGDLVSEVKEELSSNIESNKTNLDYVYSLISKSLNSYGYDRVSSGFSGDLSEGLAEVYQTGSTSRNTFVPGDKDYDYVIKVDRKDIVKIASVKEAFKKTMGLVDHPSGKLVGNIPGPNGDVLEVEISFQCKTDKNDYSTNAALDEYYESIKKLYPDDYLDVLANIVLAKKLFKEVGCYKSLKSDSNQGGLGGIGIENWILQHGGSLKDAAVDFMKVSAECEYDFSKFVKCYHVFDFGNNHYDGTYPHDDFVGDDRKMGSEGYLKMLRVLSKYLHMELTIDKDKTL